MMARRPYNRKSRIKIPLGYSFNSLLKQLSKVRIEAEDNTYSIQSQQASIKKSIVQIRQKDFLELVKIFYLSELLKIFYLVSVLQKNTQTLSLY